MHAMQVNSARRRRAGPPPAGSRPWQRELFKSMMLAPPSTQQPGEAAPAMHAAGRRRPGTWIRPAGPPAPAHRQRCRLRQAGRAAAEDGERSKTSASRRGVRARQLRSITHSAWPQLIGVQRQLQLPQHLLCCPPCSVAAAMANLLAAGQLAGCRSPAAGRPGRRWIDLGC